MDKRQKRALLNAGTTFVNQMVATICGLLIPWAMIETFGSEAYGATTSIAQFLSYISLLEGGIGRAARGELYKPLAQGDVQAISRVYLAIRRFFRNIGLIFLGYALILALCYYDIADVSTFTRDYIFWMVIAIAIGKLAEFMGGYANITLFNADQRQYVPNFVVIATSVLNVVLIIALCRSGWDLLWVKLGSSLVFVLKPIIYSVYRKLNYRIVETKERAVLSNQWTAIGQHMAYFIQNNVPVFLLTIFADLKYVAVYSVYHLVSFSLRNIVTSFGGGMEALFGNMIAKEEQEALHNSYQRYKLILTFLTVTLFGTAMMLILPFVKLYTYDVTDANYIQPLFGMVLLLADAIYCLVLPCYNLPIAANKLKESRLGAYGEAVVNVIVSGVLVFWDPLVGVALGSLAAMLFKGFYLLHFSTKRILHIIDWPAILKFGATVGVLVIIATAGNWFYTIVNIYNYWRWISAAVVVTPVMAVVAGILSAILYPREVMRFCRKFIGKSN